MKWYEVVTGCDGYYTPNRFRTEGEATKFVEYFEDPSYDGDYHISEGPYEVDTDDEFFFSSWDIEND